MNISSDLLSYLAAATQEVFEAMVFTTVEPVVPGADYRWPSSSVVASVALTGHRRGLLALHSSVATANRIAGSMLGQHSDTINGEMPDALGEVANMIAGGFRNKLAHVEPTSDISLPTVTIGSDFVTHVSHVRRAFCHFTMQGEGLYIELALSD